ncbi:Transcriptional regulator, partial [Massospora cicadina]
MLISFKINNRVAAIKATQNSPESFISSPPSTSTLVHDPSSTSNLVKALSQELGIAFNAPQFHDSRPKLEVNQDFSKAKGAFSVQLQTFQTYSEAYLRAFNQNDLKILEPHNLEYEYLVVPPPQDDSKDLWNENSKSNALKTSGKVKSAAASDPDFFTQRLFSALLPTIQNDLHEPNIEDEQIVVDDILPEETHDKVTSCLSTTPSFDTRVKYELSLLGLVQEDTSPQPPFDEITAELLRLQTKLRDLNRYNNSKKMRAFLKRQ